MKTKTRAIFLDKDGTLVANVPYNVDPGQCACRRDVRRDCVCCRRGLPAGGDLESVGSGPWFVPLEALAGVERRLGELLAEIGVPLAGCYFCPHHPEGRIAAYAVACSCRKPQPGLLLRAAWDHGLDLVNSWFIGDILDDVEAGRRAGCRTVLINNGNETEWQLNAGREPHFYAATIDEAAQLILCGSKSKVTAGV